MRKSFLIGIADARAFSLGLSKIGEKVHCYVASGGVYKDLLGRIVYRKVFAHGTMLLIENENWIPFGENYEAPEVLVVGWPLYPVWVSGCGASGIMSERAITTDPELVATIKEWKDAQAREDVQVRNAMAW